MCKRDAKMFYSYRQFLGLLFFTVFLSTAALSKSSALSESPACAISAESWTGFLLRTGLGNAFDFEVKLNTLNGRQSSAVFLYGIEYGYQFENGLFLGGAFDWTITYPRNFEFFGHKPDFLTPPIALWYTPITNMQVGWVFNKQWLTTLGIVYFWGLSNSIRYRVSDLLFIENKVIFWLDRIFNKNGYYGSGFDNFQWTAGLGFIF